MSRAMLLLASAALGLAWGQDDVAGVSSQPPSEPALVGAMQETLAQDPSVADSLAARILRSQIGGRISAAADADARMADIREWIRENPESAAQIAVGLAQDDAEGSRRFEAALLRNTSRGLRVNPEHVDKSAYGRLRKSSLESKLMGADGEMLDEEKREISKSLFEGQGNMSNQILTQQDSGTSPKGQTGSAGLAAFSNGYYDRLSHLNPRGYSPQVLAIQSALNQRRAPGAPKLRETGKLDYETLICPVYGMRYDLRNLAGRCRYQENYEIARLLGLAGRYTAEQLLSAEVEALLKLKAGAARLNSRFARRWLALERAAAAIRAFEKAAEPAKDQNALSRDVLIALGRRQKEAARWITVASLEEDIERLGSEAGFLSPELLALIAAAPLPSGTRAAYRRRGEGYRETLLKLKASAEDSARKLWADKWKEEIGAIAAALAENAGTRQDLSRNIRDFIETPCRLRSLYEPRPRWREILETAIERCLPAAGWSRQWRLRRKQRESLRDAFEKIAAGDMAAAHAILAASRQP